MRFRDNRADIFRLRADLAAQGVGQRTFPAFGRAQRRGNAGRPQHREDRQHLVRHGFQRGDVAALKAVAHKMLPIFTMLGAAGIAATLRTAESWEGPLTDALRGEIGAEAENIRAIVAEAQKKVSLP